MAIPSPYRSPHLHLSRQTMVAMAADLRRSLVARPDKSGTFKLRTLMDEAMHPMDPNCSSTPWWLPIVTGVIGLAGSAFAWFRKISIHPELRKLDRRIKVLEDQEAALREQERIEALIDARLRRGNFL